MTNTPDLTGLTPGQREYFKILEAMEPDAKLRQAIDSAKRQLIAQARAAKKAAKGAADTDETESPQVSALSYRGEEEEVLLQILLDRDRDGYAAQLSEAVTGSRSDQWGKTLAEAVEQSLSWAGVEGLKLDPAASVEEIREELSAASEAADFDLSVQLYTSF